MPFQVVRQPYDMFMRKDDWKDFVRRVTRFGVRTGIFDCSLDMRYVLVFVPFDKINIIKWYIFLIQHISYMLLGHNLYTHESRMKPLLLLVYRHLSVKATPKLLKHKN